MNDNQDNQDLDQMARTQAALAARARAQQVADNIAAAHAAGTYEQARRNAAGHVPAPPGYVPPPPPGHALPPLQPGQVIPGVPVQPPPPGFATGAIAALANVSSAAMTAIVDTLARLTGNNSYGRDGDVVVYKDISAVFDEVPEGLLERVKYVKRVGNRLLTNNKSGVRFKTD